MRVPAALSLAAFASISAVRASLYLVGDSTTAYHAPSQHIQGWGPKIGEFLQDITVVNKAVSGSSARATIRDGIWYNINKLLLPKDIVVIEFGHNDGGSPSSSDRSDVSGTNDAVTQTVTLSNGSVEVVHTYTYYLKTMIDDCAAKGATVIVSSQTPNNPYDNSATIVSGNPPRFVNYAQTVATAQNVAYTDHFAAVFALYKQLGKATVDSYYPLGHTHTNDAGALQVARAFVSALKCPSARGVLTEYLNSAGGDIAASC